METEVTGAGENTETFGAAGASENTETFGVAGVSENTETFGAAGASENTATLRSSTSTTSITRARSEVWNHFEIIDNKSKCLYCKCVYFTAQSLTKCII